MNGYNSRWGRAALPLILEEILGGANASGSEENGTNDQCTQEDSTSMKTKLFSQYTFLIGYGANDSCLPDGSCSRHHVPLDEYSSNLSK
jgi:hypothetical protein